MSKFTDFWKHTTHVTYDEGNRPIDSYQDPEIYDVETKLLEDEKLKEKDMGIGAAGPIPSSLLARQDLEGKKRVDKSSTATNDKLVDLKDKAEDAETDEQKEHLADRIKETQVKRQKATLKDRLGKTFKEAWKTLKQESEYDIALPGEPRKDKPVQIAPDEEDPEETHDE